MRRFLVMGALLAALAARAQAEEIELVSGEVLRATVVEETGSKVVLDHPLLGRIEIAAEDVRAIRPDGALVPVGRGGPPTPKPKTEAQIAAERIADPPVPEPEEPAWAFTGLVGYSGSQGNTTEFDLRVGLTAEREDSDRRIKLATGYLLSETEGERDENSFFFSALHDWILEDSKWFPFAGARYDWDEFEEWDGRVTVSAGMGYQWIDRKDLKVRFRGGLAATRESGTDDDDWRPEALLGAEFKKHLTDTQTLEGDVTYYPDLEEGGEFRTVAHLAWSVQLNDEGTLNLKAGVENEYDSHREDPFKSHDFKYYVALTFAF